MSSEEAIKLHPKQKLLIEGHYFVRLVELKKSIKWCCDKKGTLKCRSTVKTTLFDGSYKIKSGPTEHNHEQDRKLIVATPRKSIVRRSIRRLSQVNLDFGEDAPSSNPDQTDSSNKPTTPQATKYGKRVKAIPFVDQPIEAAFGVNEIKFVKWSEVKLEKLFIDGFYFSPSWILTKTLLWKCCAMKNGINCPAFVRTAFDSGRHKLKTQHYRSKHIHDETTIAKHLMRFVLKVPPKHTLQKNHNDTQSDAVKGKDNPPPKHTLQKNHNDTQSDAVKGKDNLKKENLANVSMHTQLLSRIPQEDMCEYQPPNNNEIELVILFGLRRQMMPEQIFYECQSVYGLDAPSFQTVSKYCKLFKKGYYPKSEAESQRSICDSSSANINTIFEDDPDISRECITVQPDMDCSSASL